jgi:hypothetical protein
MKAVIYRILGNALPQRHGESDVLSQARYILENEPAFPSCEKRWILNRIVDPADKQALLALLKSHGCLVEDIPFDRAAFQRTFYDPEGLPEIFNPFTPQNRGWPAEKRDGKVTKLAAYRASVWLLRRRSQELVHINHARNLILARGRSIAEWILPLDGWCYFTEQAWSEVEAAMDGAGDARYLIIPLQRLLSWPDSPQSLPPKNPDAEPQVAFHRDAPDDFDERLRYGDRNKGELLCGLGVPGRWHEWSADEWDSHRQRDLKAPGNWTMAGWVYRLPSGADEKVEAADGARYRARHSGVQQMASRLDQEAMAQMPLPRFTAGVAASLDLGPADRLLRGAMAQAEIARLSARPLRTVLDKTATPPSGDKHDYFSAPRYLHAQAGRLVHIDGVTSPASLRGAPESLGYDKFSLADFLAIVPTLTVWGRTEGGAESLQAARNWLLAWTADPQTRMNPDVRFAQWRPDRPSVANSVGVVDVRDAWMLPPLIHMLFTQGALSRTEHDAALKWCEMLGHNLLSGEQGTGAYFRSNNIGAWAHLLLVSTCMFLGHYARASSLYREVTLRLYQATDADGRQPREIVRQTPLHYMLFNLTAWTVLANHLRHYSCDIWRYEAHGGRLLDRMFDAVKLDAYKEYTVEPEKFDTWMALLAALRPGALADGAALARLDAVDWEKAEQQLLPFSLGSFAFCLACAGPAD